MVTGTGRAFDSLAATHDHAPCLGCANQQTAISRLEHDLRYERGRAAEAEARAARLQARIDQIEAIPEMGRRKWTFEE